MSSFIYFLREAIKGCKRNFTTALGSVVTIFMSLLIIGFFLIGTVMVNKVVDSVESEVTVTAYLSDDAQKASVDKLKEDIQANDKVKNVGYTSKDEALEKFKDSSSGNEEVVNQLDGQNPLPASLDVEMKDSHDVQEVASSIAENKTFKQIADNKANPAESLKYGKKTVDKLFALTNAIRIVGGIVVLLLIFIAMVFINNTIRLSILARRKEIAIMRLVGASNGFIRGPFFMESCLQSLVGSFAAILILELLRAFALPNMKTGLAWLPLDLSIGTFLIIYLVLIIAGIVIGIVGSALAMRKYLEV